MPTDNLKTRREVLTIAGTSLSLGLAGCTSSGNASIPEESSTDTTGQTTATNTPTNNAVSGTAIESIEFDDSYNLMVTLTGETDVDTIRVLNPDGSERESKSVGTGVSTVSLGSFEPTAGYTAGEYTFLAIQNEEVVQEEPMTIQPELRFTSIIPDGDGRGGADITLENTGTGPAWIRTYLIEGGFDEPMQDDPAVFMETEDGFTAHEDEHTIPVGESRRFGTSQTPFEHDSEGPACTGEGEFARDLTVTVTESALGTVSADVAAKFTGEVNRVRKVGDEACSTIEVEELPVTLTSEE